MLKQVMMIGLVLSVFQASSELSGSEGDQEYGQEVVLYEEDDQTEDSVYGVPQSAIDAFYAFLEFNSEENPILIPEGGELLEAIREQLGIGEDIHIFWGPAGPYIRNRTCGVFGLTLYEDGAPIFAQIYSFGLDLCIFHIEENAPEMTVPQYVVDRARGFLRQNSPDNRLVTPYGVGIAETLTTQMGLGANFVIWAYLEEHPLDGDSHFLCGEMFLVLYENGVAQVDSAYDFRGVCIYYQIEEPQIIAPPTVTAPETPQLPEAGSEVGGRIALGMVLVAFSGALALKQSHQIGQ